MSAENLRTLVARHLSSTFVNQSSATYFVDVQGRMISGRERNNTLSYIYHICSSNKSARRSSLPVHATARARRQRSLSVTAAGQCTASRAICIFDNYLSRGREVYQNLNSIMFACIALAKKMENESYSFDDCAAPPPPSLSRIRQFEFKILKTLDWQLSISSVATTTAAAAAAAAIATTKLSTACPAPMPSPPTNILRHHIFEYCVTYNMLNFSPLIQAVVITLRTLPNHKHHAFITKLNRYIRITAKRHKLVEQCMQILINEEEEKEKEKEQNKTNAKDDYSRLRPLNTPQKVVAAKRHPETPNTVRQNVVDRRSGRGGGGGGTTKENCTTKCTIC